MIDLRAAKFPSQASPYPESWHFEVPVLPKSGMLHKEGNPSAGWCTVPQNSGSILWDLGSEWMVS